MFDWNSLNPWGPGFDNVLFMILLAFVLAPIAWVVITLAYKWRDKHPKKHAYIPPPTRDRPWDRDGWH
jgi:hypothetical protein